MLNRNLKIVISAVLLLALTGALVVVALRFIGPEKDIRPVPVPSPAASAKRYVPADGWKVVQGAGGAVSAAMPSGWTEMKVDPAEMKKEIAAYRKNSPEMADLLQGLLSPGITLLWGGYEEKPAEGGGFRASASLVGVKVEPGLKLDELEGQNLEIARKLAEGGKVEHSDVKLPAGNSGVLSYLVGARTSAGRKMALSITQHMLLRGDRAYILTCTTTSDRAEKDGAIFGEVAKSLRFH